MAFAVAFGIDVVVNLRSWVALGVTFGLRYGDGVAVGVGLDAATTVKLTVMDAPLVPVAPVPLHGVAAKV